MSLEGVAVQWMDDLLQPIRSSHEKAQSLAERAKKINHIDTEAQRGNS
jgi:hypothetical protein